MPLYEVWVDAPTAAARDAVPLQTRILRFVQVHHAVYGYPPTVTEIMHAMGITSRGHVAYHLQRLVTLGKLRKAEGWTARAWLPVVPAQQASTQQGGRV